MKLKLDIDIPVPGWAKPALLVLTIPFAIIVAASVGRADVPNTFMDGDTLSAMSLNENFASVDARVAAVEPRLVPAGTIVAFGGEAPPQGWLPCDGTLLDGTDDKYAELYAAIGTAYGGSATSENFNLPDLRGRFVRGWDDGAGNDPDAAVRTGSTEGGNTGDAVGSLQQDEFESHTHGATRVFKNGIHSMGADSGFYDVDLADMAGGAETRPRNVSVNYIIKL